AAQDDEHAADIRVSLAKVETNMTKEQIAQAQHLAHEFKPAQKSPPTAPDTADRISSATSIDAQSRSNRLAAPESPSKGGFVTVKADTDDCEVFVDGAFVGNSPAKLHLSEGPHVIEVRKAGHKDYRRELKVIAGSELSLRAALEKQ